MKSLVKQCDKYYNLCSTKEYIDDYAAGSKVTAQRHKRFFKYLIKYKHSNLRKIITSPPSEHDILTSEILNILKKDDLYRQLGSEISQSKFGKLLSETIFNYKRFRKSVFCKELFKELDFKMATCPYCNDRKVEVVNLEPNSTKDEILKAYFDLDHFYPKSQNPYLSVSFFNLIPTCHTCNSSEKGDKPFSVNSHIHPYLESFEDIYRFKISLVTQLGDKADKITLENKIVKLNDKTIKDLNLEGRYNNNIGLANDLVELYNKYKHTLGTSAQTMFIELLLNGIPTKRKRILHFQRAKMSRDILQQLDINGILGIE